MHKLSSRTFIALSLSTALYSTNAFSQVTNIATSGGLTGGPITTTGTVAIADGGVTSAKIADGSIGQVDINATQVQRRVSGSCAVGSSIRSIATDGTVSCEFDDNTIGWGLSGNAGTNPATQFLGTTDAQAFVIRTNNVRSLRLEPNGNAMLGVAGNSIAAGARGAFVAGGAVSGDLLGDFPNIVTDSFGTISGGSWNQAGDNLGTADDQPFATVGGGWANQASSFASTVAGGEANRAIGAYSVISGGGQNWATGLLSSISGGYQNCAGGNLSWSGGRQAKVRPAIANELGACNQIGNSGDANGDEGTFAWADAQATNFVSTGPNQFLVRASGGIYLGANSTVSMPAGRFINTSTGAHLTTGGSWTNASSRALKLGFAEVDALQVLSKLSTLPITTWRYRGSEEGTHMGPVAEDFKATFDLSGDGKSISTVDANGVALAAIQGLNQKLEAENALLRAQLSTLASRLDAIEAQ